VIKFNLIEDVKFDYRKLIWADEEEGAATLANQSAPR